jgi:Tol biopolymer transport system component
VLLIPSEGGPERKVAEIVNDSFLFSLFPPYLSWTADSKYLVAPDRQSPGETLSLFVLSVATGEERRLTTPPATTLGDGNPAVSPDGRTLAFARIVSEGNPQLYLLPLSADCRPAGEVRRLDLPKPFVASPAWSADGREIVCDAGGSWGTNARLWRIAVSGSEKHGPVALVGESGRHSTISRQGNRLVYAHWTWDGDIWRIEIARNGRAGPPVKLPHARGRSATVLARWLEDCFYLDPFRPTRDLGLQR